MRTIWISVPGAWCYAWFELSARMQVARFRPTAYLRMNLARNIGILVLGVITMMFVPRGILAQKSAEPAPAVA